MLQSYLGDLFEESDQFVDSVAKELEMYKAEKPIDLESDPLEWWYQRKTFHPLISRLVQRMFSFVATSRASFSSAGNIITEKRNCLTPQHADQLIFLYENTK